MQHAYNPILFLCIVNLFEVILHKIEIFTNALCIKLTVLKQSVNKDLKGFDGTKHIILLTDGGENCEEK